MNEFEIWITWFCIFAVFYFASQIIQFVVLVVLLFREKITNGSRKI